MKRECFFGYRSFEPEYDTMKEMRKRGVDNVTIMVSNNTNFMGSPYTRYQPTWIWNREYDFSLFDKNMKDVTDAVPDVKLNVVLDLNPPSWWKPRLAGREVPLPRGQIPLELQKRLRVLVDAVVHIIAVGVINLALAMRNVKPILRLQIATHKVGEIRRHRLERRSVFINRR